MKTKILVLMVLLGVSFSMVFGNGQKEEKSGKPVVALIMKSLANEFFLTMEEGAKKHQSKNVDMYELIANGIKNESDVDAQTKIVELMIVQQVDAIVIAPADSKALIPVVKKAMDAGIVVVNIDNKFDKDALSEKKIMIPFVGPNNRTGAKKVGDYLAKFLKNGDEVSIIEGVPTTFNGQMRTAGFTDSMNEAGINIVSVQTGMWETDKAYTIASATMSESPNLKAILCGNDSMALGAVAAVKAADKKGDVLVVGFDNISAVHDMLQDGRILATADQYASDMAVQGILYSLSILNGSDPTDQETPVDLIKKQ